MALHDVKLSTKKTTDKGGWWKMLHKKICHKLTYVSCDKMNLKYLQGHLISPEILPQNAVVVDLGGNKGAFSKAMAENFAATCYCVEPNPELFEKIDSNSLIKKANIAISDKEGTMELTLSQNEEASSFFPGIVDQWGIKEKIMVQTMTLKNYCRINGITSIDLLKVDIEGSELSLFNTLSDAELMNIPQLTVEFHEFLDDSLLEPTKAAIRRFEKLGFLTIVYSREKYADVLFLNKRYFKMGLEKRIWYVIHRLVAYKAA